MKLTGKGLVSWDAWPKPGQSKMTTVEDHLYQDNLQGKKYMMGISPWFYTGKTIPILSLLVFQNQLNPTRSVSVEQELVLLQRVSLARPLAAGPRGYAGFCSDHYLYAVPTLVPLSSFPRGADAEKGMTLASPVTFATHHRRK
jgi:hypothetical protein